MLYNYKPLVLPKTEEKVARILSKENEAYSLIFLLMINTGIPFNHCVKKSVADLKKTEITYPTKSRKSEHCVAIPKDLQQALKKYLAGKKAPQYAFADKNGDPIPKYEFLRALTVASSKDGLCLNPPLHFKSLTKTYVYHMYRDNCSISEIKSCCGVKSADELTEYLHLGEYYDGEIKYLEKNYTKAQNQAVIKRLQKAMTHIAQNRTDSDKLAKKLNHLLEDFGL